MITRWNERDVALHREDLAGLDAEGILRWVAGHVSDPVLSSSMGQEDQVLLHLIVSNGLNIPVITLDTGRLFPETYDLIAATEAAFGIRIRVVFPDAREVESMVAEEGINLFRRSVELRRRCCSVRKVAPLRRALEGAGGWICGLRQGQSSSRTALDRLEWDAGHGIPKISPLVDWSLEQVTQHLQTHRVPYNPLHDRGFSSIGCACCTRAVAPGEDLRAGRWWWEQAQEHKECGLHRADGRLVREPSSEEDHA